MTNSPNGLYKENALLEYRRAVNTVCLVYPIFIVLSFTSGIFLALTEMLIGVTELEKLSPVLVNEISNVLASVILIGVPSVILRAVSEKRGLFSITASTDEYPMCGGKRSFIFKSILPLTFVLFLMSSVMASLSSLLGWTVAPTNGVVPGKNDLLGIILRIISTAAIPAFFEELLFRGAMLRLLLPFGRAPAIILSSVIFGVFHMSGANIAYTFTAGLLFALAAVESGSLIPSMVMHFLNNALVFVQEIWEVYFPNAAELFISVEMFLRIALGLISIILVFGRRGGLLDSRREESGGLLSGEELVKGALTPITVGCFAIVMLFAVLTRGM